MSQAQIDCVTDDLGLEHVEAGSLAGDFLEMLDNWVDFLKTGPGALHGMSGRIKARMHLNRLTEAEVITIWTQVGFADGRNLAYMAEQIGRQGTLCDFARSELLRTAQSHEDASGVNDGPADDEWINGAYMAQAGPNPR